MLMVSSSVCVFVVNNSDPQNTSFVLHRATIAWIYSLFTNKAYVGYVEVTHIGLFVVIILFYTKSIFRSILTCVFLYCSLHDFQILYTDVQIFYLGGQGVRSPANSGLLRTLARMLMPGPMFTRPGCAGRG